MSDAINVIGPKMKLMPKPIVEVLEDSDQRNDTRKYAKQFLHVPVGFHIPDRGA